ncbi:MAG: hypothetical protein WBF58_13105 [Xanthobacteraceae bacterium]
MDITKHSDFFDRHASLLATYFSSGAREEDILGKLNLAQQGPITIAYAPFDHVPLHADLVIVGITPGRTQATNAIAAACTALRVGKDNKEASRLAKITGSFSGPMRANLISMLDHVGLASALRIASCTTLFDPDRESVHLTSALRYPVFVAGANYNGSPDMLKTPLLKSMIDACLADEARQLGKAIWLPLGPQPVRALDYLCSRGLLDRRQVLVGLPHPSGANAERIAYFTGRKTRQALSPKTNPETLDATLIKLRQQVANLSLAA